MGEHLGECRFSDLRVQVGDILANGIVEPELAQLAQLHHSCCRETLGMRRYPKAMTRREALALGEIGIPERLLEDELALVRNCHHAARLLRHAHLEFEPARDVLERWSQPFLHHTGSISQLATIAFMPQRNNIVHSLRRVYR